MALDLTEAVEAAARASYEDWRQSPNAQGSWRPVWEEAPTMLRVNITEAVLPTVTAVAPLIEAQVREQIASEIEALDPMPTSMDFHFDPGDLYADGLATAARIARGVTS